MHTAGKQHWAIAFELLLGLPRSGLNFSWKPIQRPCFFKGQYISKPALQTFACRRARNTLLGSQLVKNVVILGDIQRTCRSFAHYSKILNSGLLCLSTFSRMTAEHAHSVGRWLPLAFRTRCSPFGEINKLSSRVNVVRFFLMRTPANSEETRRKRVKNVSLEGVTYACSFLSHGGGENKYQRAAHHGKIDKQALLEAVGNILHRVRFFGNT